MNDGINMRTSVIIVIVAALTAVLASWGFNILAGNAPEDQSGSENASQITISDRETTALGDVIIQDVVSGDGSIVAANDGDGWLVVVSVKPVSQAYTLLEQPVSVKASIEGGPGAFDCEWDGIRSGPDGQPAMYCKVPEDIRAAESLPASMVVVRTEPRQTQGLPVTSVLGSEQQGVAVVVDSEGNTEVRQLEIGVTDTQHVEVLSGLSPDERVLLIPTQLDLNWSGD